MPTYYVYRHIREDLNVPFYIGIGTIHKENSRKEDIRYKRAFSNENRNNIWNSIVSKTNYSVEIFWETENRKDAFDKEVEFIKIYGRRDLGLGTLSNLTDGGEGGLNMSIESIQRMVKKNRDNGSNTKHGIRLAELNRRRGNIAKGKDRPIEYPLHKETFVYSNIDGRFITSFYSRKEAAVKMFNNKNRVSAICNSIKTGKPFNDFLFFDSLQQERVDINPFTFRCKKVYKISPLTKDVESVFSSLFEASKSSGVAANTLCTIVKNKRIHNGYIWSYDSVVNINDFRGSRSVSTIGVRKTTCSRCGNSKENIKYSYCKSCRNKRYKEYYNNIKK